MLKSFLVRALIVLVLVSGCSDDEKDMKPGQVSFSFSSKDAFGIKASEDVTPAFVMYSIRKPNGSIISKKIELYSFNGEFITQPQLFLPGEYHIKEFLVLNQSNQIIYASPMEDSPLADLVEKPLPYQFFIPYTEETVHVVPEVLEVRDHLPSDFGYATFGLDIVDIFHINMMPTIASDEDHPPIDYTVEIIAKDGALGNVQWSKTVHLTDEGQIHIPAKYAHYTIKASMPGFIPHVKHFRKQELVGINHLQVEFIPESLEGFIVHQWENGDIKLYLPNEADRLRMYARVDVAEGYRLSPHFAFMMGVDRDYVEVGPFAELWCYASDMDCTKQVNIFGPTYAHAQNYGELIDYTKVDSRDDVIIYIYHEVWYARPADAHIIRFQSVEHEWHGANTTQP